MRRHLPAFALLFALGACSYSSPPPPPTRGAVVVPVAWLRSETTSRAAETTYRRRVVEIELRQFRVETLVGRDRHDIAILRMQQRLPRGRAVDLQLRHALALEALDQHQVARGQPLEQLRESRLRRAPQLVHQRPAPRRADQHLAASGVAVAIGVLARLIHVEGVVGVLDEGDREPARDEERDQLLDQGRLSAAGPAGESEYLHIRNLADAEPTNSLTIIISNPGRKIDPYD